MRRPDNLNYKVSGDCRSSAVLFLHGFMGSSADWREVSTALGERAFCIAVDLPGHGASLGLLSESYTIEGVARAVIRTMEEPGVERPAIVGYSMGGRLALYLALRYPERCAALCLESASPGLESTEERTARRAVDEERAKRLESEGLDEFLEDWYRQPLFASMARDKNLLRKTLEARRRNDPEELARSLRGMGSQPSLWGELDDLDTPALAIAGELDEKYVRISSRMASISPRIESAVVRGAGHNVHAEASAEYVVLLERLLDAV